MLYTSTTLPLCKTVLDDWQLIKVAGIDNTKYLQGQLSADINQLTDQHYLLSAHCDPKGKTLSNLLLFKRDADIYYLLRKSVAETQLNELKKFAIFSKVTIEVDTLHQIVGVAAQDMTTEHLSFLPQFNETENCQTSHNITFLRLDFPVQRYLIIGLPAEIEKLSFPPTIQTTDCQQWALLDMEANYPLIDLPVSAQYLPQAFNLQQFNAISFTKGCYCGQEMVARAQYRGINKRALFLLSGTTNANEPLPTIGATLEQKIGENWRETGCITARIKLDEKTLWIQAILANDIESDAILRIVGSQHQLTIVQSA